MRAYRPSWLAPAGHPGPTGRNQGAGTGTRYAAAAKRRILEKGNIVNTFLPYMQIIQIIISIALIVIILAQAKGQGGLGGIFGGDATVYHTRRGVEKTLYHITIGLAVLFFVTSLISVLVA